jgi:hypothetical protein
VSHLARVDPREDAQACDCPIGQDHDGSASELFAAAQRAVAERIRAVMGVPQAQVGSLRDAVWKTDEVTGVGHLVYLNKTLCPWDNTRTIDWLPSYAAKRRCHTCSAIEAQQLAAEDDQTTTEEEQ